MAYMMTMSRAARGYAQAGKKLLPRDYGDMQTPGRNQRERARNAAAERAHYAKQDPVHFGLTASERRIARTSGALSAKRRAPVETLIILVVSDGDWDWARKLTRLLGRAQRRYFNALENDYFACMAQSAEERMWG